MRTDMFAAISPYISWTNKANWYKTKQLFHPTFNQVHLTASSSDLGLEREYYNKSLVGGAAILTFGLWASKVSQSTQDESGNGTFTIASIQGRRNKTISFISAYIAVQKGAKIGIDSVYTQQVPCMKRELSNKIMIQINDSVPGLTQSNVSTK